MKLETVELKFLLKLLGQPGYRAPMSKLMIGGSKGLTNTRDKACRKLCTKGLVGCRDEAQEFVIAPPGQALLNADLQSLPISAQALKVLQRCEQLTTPKQLTNVPSMERQAVIRSLEARGLVTVSKSVLKEAWLTAEGAAFLRDDCQPDGAAMISLRLMGNYLRFLRRPDCLAGGEQVATSSRMVTPQSQVEVLRAIAQLDAQHETENYLPIFLLRQELPMGRDLLEQTLYELQRQGQVELGTVQQAAVDAYSPEQLAAGIPQSVGGALFFISLCS